MKTYIVAIVIVTMLVGMMPVAPARAVLVLGQLASNGATLDGITVPSGTTILDPSTIATGDDPAVIHLINGSVLAMAPHSKASFSGESGGKTTLAVETGEVILRDQAGEPVILKADTSVVIQEEGVQEGESGPEEDEDDDDEAAAAGGGGDGWPLWAWLLIGGAAAGGIYAIVDDGGDSTPASGTTTG